MRKLLTLISVFMFLMGESVFADVGEGTADITPDYVLQETTTANPIYITFTAGASAWDNGKLVSC